MATEYKHAERKFKKHMVEKRRRNRINYALDQLKKIVLNGLQKDPSQYDKMEKADILDLTVSYLFKVKTNNPITALARRFTSTPVTSYPATPCDYFAPVTSQGREEPPRNVTSPLNCIPFDENNNAVGQVNLNYSNLPPQPAQPLTPPSVNFDNYNDQHSLPPSENEEIDIESIENDSLEDLNNSWSSTSSNDHDDDDVSEGGDNATCEKDDMWRPW
uniref:Hairy enhancer of split 12 n=1 Tax=Platynereis dumerilii TaxID=6359 RepID=S5UGP7_PLADU|nr:hairy enhancer of split 12 [Platynereis dumerilii]